MSVFFIYSSSRPDMKSRTGNCVSPQRVFPAGSARPGVESGKTLVERHCESHGQLAYGAACGPPTTAGYLAGLKRRQNGIFALKDHYQRAACCSAQWPSGFTKPAEKLNA
jgi:hypothetical protein